MTTNGLISQVQAAGLLGISRARVNQLIAEGKLTPIPIAGRNLLLSSQVMDLMQRRGKAQETAVEYDEH